MQQQSLDCQRLVQKLESVFADQNHRQGLHEQATAELRDSLKDMRVSNRNRSVESLGETSQSWDLKEERLGGVRLNNDGKSFGPSRNQEAMDALKTDGKTTTLAGGSHDSRSYSNHQQNDPSGRETIHPPPLIHEGARNFPEFHPNPECSRYLESRHSECHDRCLPSIHPAELSNLAQGN